MSLVGKTFILNSSITVSTNFGAANNSGDKILFTCNNVSYNSLSAWKLSSTTYAQYGDLSWSETRTYQNGWVNENYRTITFAADPTNYTSGFTELSQFEEWLGANATEVYDDNAETFTATDGKSYHFRDDRLPYVDGNDNGKVLMVSGGEWIADEQATFTGATGVTGGSDGLVPAPAAADDTKFLRGDGTWANGGRPMVILSYGNSTWSDFITAYYNNVIVYCRASSNNDPATGSQTRMAFMAYVNDAAIPTEVEFQYYRSVSTHSDDQQGDQVYVYKLTSSGTWTVTVRSAFTKIVAGTNLTSSYSNGALTLSGNYSVASTASDGLMSSTDKTTLDKLNDNYDGSVIATANCDDYVTPGIYKLSGAITNSPESAVRLTLCVYVSGSGFIVQIAYVNLQSNYKTYKRRKLSGVAWTSWTSDEDSIAALNNQIANKIVTRSKTLTSFGITGHASSGIYYSSSATIDDAPSGYTIIGAYINGITGAADSVMVNITSASTFELLSGSSQTLTSITIVFAYAKLS